MKIAFCNRPSWDSPLGGDGVQMIKTRDALEKKYPVKIDIITNPNDLEKGYDIIHVFNYATWKITRSFFEKAIELNVPIVSSSIFWDYTYAWNRLTNLFVTDHVSKFSSEIIRKIARYLANVCGYPIYLSSRFRKQLIYFTENSRLILPNSNEEGELLLKFIKRKEMHHKIHVVYNASDSSEEVHYLPKNEFDIKYGLPENYILQVGRIEPVKNQINLVYALKNYPDIPIVFIGKVSDNRYMNKLKRISEKRGNVYFLDAVPHDEIATFYKYASIHVLLSLRESPGLVSLEALNHDCPIVVANEKYTPTKTYFANQPYIVDPFNIKEIEKILLLAYKERRLHKELINNFTWDIVAEQTYLAYSKIKK